MFKRQQFENNKNEEAELRVSKHQRVDIYDDKKGQSLDRYKGEGEGKDVEYILFLFVTLSPLQKKSNCPIDMGKRTKSLNHLVYMPKIGLLYNC